MSAITDFLASEFPDFRERASATAEAASQRIAGLNDQHQAALAEVNARYDGQFSEARATLAKAQAAIQELDAPQG